MVVIVVLLILIVIGAGAFGGYCLVCVILLEDLRRGIYVALKILLLKLDPFPVSSTGIDF